MLVFGFFSLIRQFRVYISESECLHAVELRVPFLNGHFGGIVAVLMSVRSSFSNEPLVRGRVGFRVLMPTAMVQ